MQRQRRRPRRDGQRGEDVAGGERDGVLDAQAWDAVVVGQEVSEPREAVRARRRVDDHRQPALLGGVPQSVDHPSGHRPGPVGEALGSHGTPQHIPPIPSGTATAIPAASHSARNACPAPRPEEGANTWCRQVGKKTTSGAAGYTGAGRVSAPEGTSRA